MVDDERRGPIWQKSATKVTEFKCCKLVPNALLLWEPVKFFQKWYDMITLQFFHNKLGSIIPEFFVGLRFVHSQHLQNGITVVQSQGDHGRDTLRDWVVKNEQISAIFLTVRNTVQQRQWMHLIKMYSSVLYRALERNTTSTNIYRLAANQIDAL